MASDNFSKYDRDKISLRISIGEDTFTGETIRKLKIIRGTNGADKFKIGSSLSAFTEFSIFDEKVEFSQKSFFGKVAKIEIGAPHTTHINGIEWIVFGEYILETPKKNADNSWNFEGYDILQKARKVFDSSKLSYPLTIFEIVSEACRQSEINLDTKYWKNSDKIIDKPIQFYEASCKEVIDAAAELALSVAYINPSTQNLEIKAYTEESNFINADLIASFKKEEEEVRKGFDHIIIKQVGTADYMAGQGEAPLFIEDNLFIQGDANRFAPSILTFLPGLTANKGIKLVWKGDPTLSDVGIYKFEYLNAEYSIIPQVRTFEFDGGLQEIIECKSASYVPDSSKERKQVRNIYKVGANLEIAKQEILASIGDEVGNKIVELGLTQDGITQTVKNYVTENKAELKGDKGDAGIRGPQGPKGDKGAPGTPADNSKITEHESKISHLANQITSKVSLSTYNVDKTLVDSKLSTIEQKADNIKLQVDSKGKHRNFVANSDSWTEAPVATSSDAFTSVRDSDNSVEIGIKLANKESLFRFMLDRHETTNGNNTLFFSRANYIGSGIGSLTFRLQDENFNNVSNIQVISQATEVYDFAVTKKAKYLVFGIRSTSNNTNVRIYKESIALVDGQISGLKWDNTYINDSGSIFEMKLNKITLKASQIDLHGLVTANNGFRINLDGSMEATAGKIGGFNIRDKVLESGSGDSYIRISGTPNYTPILIGGNTWESANFGVSTRGIIKAKNPRLNNANIHDSIIRGEHYGYGNFSSGNYIGTGNFSSGYLAGTNYYSDNGMVYFPSISAGEMWTGQIKNFIQNPAGEWVTNTAFLRFARWEFDNSDIRLKENIEELTDEYNQFIYDLPLIKYTYIADEKHAPQVGVNANYLMKILPDYMARSFLHVDEKTGYYGANYELLVPYMIKAIQENHKEIKELIEEIRRLKNVKNNQYNIKSGS